MRRGRPANHYRAARTVHTEDFRCRAGCGNSLRDLAASWAMVSTTKHESNRRTQDAPATGTTSFRARKVSSCNAEPGPHLPPVQSGAPRVALFGVWPHPLRQILVVAFSSQYGDMHEEKHFGGGLCRSDPDYRTCHRGLRDGARGNFGTCYERADTGAGSAAQWQQRLGRYRCYAGQRETVADMDHHLQRHERTCHCRSFPRPCRGWS